MAEIINVDFLEAKAKRQKEQKFRAVRANVVVLIPYLSSVSSQKPVLRLQ